MRKRRRNRVKRKVWRLGGRYDSRERETRKDSDTSGEKKQICKDGKKAWRVKEMSMRRDHRDTKCVSKGVCENSNGR